MPQLGLGFWRTPQHNAAEVVRTAIDAGYRLIDTAAAYGNERGVGEGLRAAGPDAGPIFVTTKLWNDQQGYDRTLRAFDESLTRLGLGAVDLYLIHWPAPARGLYVESWRALVRLNHEGRARSIGVSNFEPEHLRRIISETGMVPAVRKNVKRGDPFAEACIRLRNKTDLDDLAHRYNLAQLKPVCGSYAPDKADFTDMAD